MSECNDRIWTTGIQVIEYMHNDLGLCEDDLIDVIMAMTAGAAGMLARARGYEQIDPYEQLVRYFSEVVTKKQEARGV